MASTARKAAAAAAAVPLLLLLAEGGASAVLSWRDAGDGISEERHCVHDPDLGWSNARSVRVSDLYGPGRHLTTNARGFRALEEYTREVPEGRYRVVCLGDSFTLGYGVGDRSTWPAKLEALEPRIQAVNMGQGGYGVDQAYLWYLRDGTVLEADLVLLAFIAPDFDRMLDDRFQGEYPKPVLRAADGRLEVENVPVPDEWGRSARRSAARALEELALTRLFDRALARSGHGTASAPPVPPSELPWREEAALVIAELARISRERGRAFALVQIPLRDPHPRAASVSAFVRQAAEREDVPFLELSRAFGALPPGEAEDLYLPDGHLHSGGNAFVAETLAAELRRILPGFP